MATLTELQAEFNEITASIKALTQPKMDEAKAKYEAEEAVKSEEQKITELQARVNSAREFLNKLQAGQ